MGAGTLSLGKRLMTTEAGTPLEGLHHAAQEIFFHALDTCDIGKAFDRHLHFEETTLIRHPSAAVQPVSIPLDRYKKIFVVALGKAALTMLDTLLDRLPRKLHAQGICSAPELPRKRRRHIHYFAGGHPLPNEDSFEAAEETLRLLRKARNDTFVFFLISGGGSAMFELPRNRKISLEDTIAFHETLVASGASITEINTVRKYFSAVKGGRLALAASEAEKLSLLLADVPLKDLGSVASSPTLPDQSSLGQCREILARYRLLEKFPSAVREYFESLSSEVVAETQGKTADQAFKHMQFDTLLSNHDFVNAARDRAQELGFRVLIDNSCDDWDYADASRYLLKRFHELRAEHPRLCLLSSGEVTVQLSPTPGCGGRNQQFALASAFDLAKYESQPLTVLSAGSDGIDGNSPAAGAIADTTTIARARAYHFDAEEHLARFNTCPLFTALGDTIVTGPTGNNLRDLRILLAARGGK